MTQRKQPTRRSFVKGSVGAAAAGWAVSQYGTPLVTASQNAGEITFMNWDTIDGTPLETAINAFAETTGTAVNVQPTPTQDYDTKFRTLLASGSPPDVMRINDDFVRGYSVANQLMDLRPFIEESGLNPDEYNQHPFNFPVQPNGAHTAWSIGTQPGMIFYNKTMFEEAGVELPPGTWTSEGWTWDDFLETARQLTDADTQQWGALIYDDTGSETIFSVNNGEESGIYSVDGTEFTLANPKGIEAIQWLADLSCVHEVQPPWSQLQQDDAGNQLFAAGRVGMIERTFGTASYFHQNAVDFEWDVAPVPAGAAGQTTIATLTVFCIPKDAPNPEGAWELLKFLGGPEGGRIFAEAGEFAPVYTETVDLLQPVNGTPEHLDLLRDAVANSTNENFGIHIPQARLIYRPQLDLIYTCQESAEDVLTSIRQDVEDALAGEV
jgi:multiple sugar transport system substrate-binding protein